MRRTHHKRGEAIPRAFRGEDKKKSASGGTPIVIIAALLGAVYYVTRTHPTQHAAAHTNEIMQLIVAQNRTIAALRGAAARAVAERAPRSAAQPQRRSTDRHHLNQPRRAQQHPRTSPASGTTRSWDWTRRRSAPPTSRSSSKPTRRRWAAARASATSGTGSLIGGAANGRPTARPSAAEARRSTAIS